MQAKVSLLEGLANRGARYKPLLDVSIDQLQGELQRLAEQDNENKRYDSALAQEQTRAALLRSFLGKNPKFEPRFVDALDQVSWFALFTSKWDLARNAADEALNNNPFNVDDDRLWIATNDAHARMFAGDIEGARRIYLQYEAVCRRPLWEWFILDDFGKFKAARLGAPPLMQEITALFTKK